jgi:hypothetical protein
MESILVRFMFINPVEISRREMRKNTFFWVIVSGLTLLCSCHNANSKVTDNQSDANKIIQEADGTISLKLDKATCYNDKVDPSGNTAEWDVVVSKSGRYNVWLSSSTKDTTDLKYKNPVMVSVQDTRLEGHPGINKIILNSGDVSYPYFRADTFVGSMYIQDTGTFNIQVICEKILPKDYNNGNASGEELSKLISVSFTPVIR